MRPRKKRRVGYKGKFKKFGPKGLRTKDKIIFNADELESIRLMDYKEMTQQECADIMGIGRTTFQRIYKNARKKIGISMIENKDLVLMNDQDEVEFKINN